MSSKRKYNLDKEHVPEKLKRKHTLDSDEEDSDEYEKDENVDGYIDGEEDGVERIGDDIKITPFNMREELEEGQFDKEGHYHRHKVDEIRDNWLDNIDWVKVDEKSIPDLNEDEANVESVTNVDTYELYVKLLSFMQKNETISKTLQRLGKHTSKLSTIERIRRKKRGEIDNDATKITMFTELADKLLTVTGNMSVYQLTYDELQLKTEKSSGLSKANNNSCSDMYSDNFNDNGKKNVSEKINLTETTEKKHKKLLWEVKWTMNDALIEGPYDTEKMMEFSKNGVFKSGVYVRKVGDDNNFYASSRIDFELYL